MSPAKIFLRALELVAALSSLSGLVYSWVLGAHIFFGVIEMGPFEWYLICQACAVSLIVINWPPIKKLYKRATGQAERERKEKQEKNKLDTLLSLIRENLELLVLKIQNEGKLPMSSEVHYQQINLRLKIRLRAFGFDMPREGEWADKDFDSGWCSFISLLQVAIEEGIYKNELSLWKRVSSKTKELKNP